MRVRSVLPILRSAALRSAATFAGTLTICVVLLFGFIYWQTTRSETARIDSVIVNQARLIAGAPPEQILARVRAQLERTRGGTPGREDLERAIDRAIGGLDQSISITTALLRLAEIEGSSRRDAFGSLDLVEIAREVAEFYEPLAEQKRISLQQDLRPCRPLHGDRDLLFEAVANLVDNAIKFTPDGYALAIEDGESGCAMLLTCRPAPPHALPDQAPRQLADATG